MIGLSVARGTKGLRSGSEYWKVPTRVVSRRVREHSYNVLSVLKMPATPERYVSIPVFSGLSSVPAMIREPDFRNDEGSGFLRTRGPKLAEDFCDHS